MRLYMEVYDPKTNTIKKRIWSPENAIKKHVSPEVRKAIAKVRKWRHHINQPYEIWAARPKLVDSFEWIDTNLSALEAVNLGRVDGRTPP